MKFLKTMFTALAVIITVALSAAEARINTTRISCSQAKELVQSRGSIVLNTGRNTYDRFVANHSYCDTGDIARRSYVHTRGNNSCFIGYTCQPFEGGGSRSRSSNGYLLFGGN